VPTENDLKAIPYLLTKYKFMKQFSYFDILMKTINRFDKRTSLKMIVIFMIVLVLVQCKPGSGKQAVGEIAEIDVTANYPLKEFYLQDIAEVEYIPFETNSNALMGRSTTIFYVSDNYIIASSYSEGDIFVYDGKGKWKYSFNHRGQGPTEYNRPNSIAFDEKAKEIYVSDWYSASPRIIVYAENGEYKRTLPYPPDFQPYLYNFDDETLFIYDEYGIFQMDGYSNRPYIFMSKKDGSFTDSLNIYLPVRLSNISTWQEEVDGQMMMVSRGYSISYNRSYGKNFLIADWSADTIYRLTPQKELQPMIVRKPAMQSTDPKILISNFLVTDKFILLGIHGMDYAAMKDGRNISQKQLMYDFKTGETNEYRLKNKDIPSSTNVMIRDAITPENTGISIYDAGFLFDLDDKGEISGDLKEVIKSLDADNNPVLVKIKF